MLYVGLDSVRSVYNVGSVFRTANAAGVDKLILAGITPFPSHPKMEKTALGSQHQVAWEHHCDMMAAATYYTAASYTLVCFETTSSATSLFEVDFPENALMVFGNEKQGINQSLLKQAEKIVTIPHYGTKESLNIASAAAIGIYAYRRQYPHHNITHAGNNNSHGIIKPKQSY